MTATGSETVRATGILALILAVVFFPFVVGQSSLLMSTWDAPSVVSSGAYDQAAVPSHYGRTPDPGAPAWVSEPWLKLIENQVWKEHSAPLWNPYAAYGTPLAAAMQPQSFYPLAILTSLHVSVWTYNLFILGRLLIAGVLMFLFARLLDPDEAQKIALARAYFSRLGRSVVERTALHQAEMEIAGLKAQIAGVASSQRTGLYSEYGNKTWTSQRDIALQVLRQHTINAIRLERERSVSLRLWLKFLMLRHAPRGLKRITPPIVKRYLLRLMSGG